MIAHDRLDCLTGLVCVVERNCANVVVENVGFDDAMEKVWTDRPKVAVDGSSGATDEVPRFVLVVRKRWIAMLEVRDGNLKCVLARVSSIPG